MTIGVKPSQKKTIQSYTAIFFAAALYTIGLQGFLQVAKTFATGVSAFGALPTFIWTDLVPYVSFIILGLNIPILLFFWKKNKRRFMVKTVFFLVVQTALGSLFIIDDISDIFHHLLHYANLASSTPREEGWPIIVMALIGSTLIGFSVGLAWKFGGSTGGTDIVTYYYSTKKQKSVGSILFIISLSILAFSFTVAVSIKQDIRDYWLLTLFSSFSYILVTTAIVNYVYPKYSKVELVITSDKIDEIWKALIKDEYWHSWRVVEYTSGFHKVKKREIRTIIFLLESREIIRFIHSIDPNAWISITEVVKVSGQLNQTVVDEEN